MYIEIWNTGKSYHCSAESSLQFSISIFSNDKIKRKIKVGYLENNQAGPNKCEGWNFFKKTNKRAGQIKSSRVENPLEINKRACSSIRHSRVHTYLHRYVLELL